MNTQTLELTTQELRCLRQILNAANRPGREDDVNFFINRIDDLLLPN